MHRGGGKGASCLRFARNVNKTPPPCVHFPPSRGGTVKTTSPDPVLPAASRTRSTTTCVPALSASVLKRNVSVLLSNRPSVGKTLTHFLPLTANDAAVSRANGSVA